MYEKYAKLSFQIQSVVISIFIKPKWPDQVVLFPNFIYGMAEFVHIKSGHFVMNNQVFIYMFLYLKTNQLLENDKSESFTQRRGN